MAIWLYEHRNTNGWNSPWDVAKKWMMVYQNETRLVGRPDVPVIITETGWCAPYMILSYKVMSLLLYDYSL